MNGSRWPIVLTLLALPLGSGCQGAPRRSIASAEPGLYTPKGSGTTIVEAPPAQSITFVDRHPLLSKPREYYQRPGNKAVNAAAATVIGIPAGAMGEVRQIFGGRPPGSSY